MTGEAGKAVRYISRSITYEDVQENRTRWLVEFFKRLGDVSNPDACWPWTGYCTNGYGQMSIVFDGILIHARAHRLAYFLFSGKLKNGNVPDHLCRNRKCANPNHLEQVSNGENVLRGIGVSAENKVKTHCKSGHPFVGPNLKILSNGDRHCIECHRIGQRNHVKRILERNYA